MARGFLYFYIFFVRFRRHRGCPLGVRDETGETELGGYMRRLVALSALLPFFLSFLFSHCRCGEYDGECALR